MYIYRNMIGEITCSFDPWHDRTIPFKKIIFSDVGNLIRPIEGNFRYGGVGWMKDKLASGFDVEYIPLLTIE